MLSAANDPGVTGEAHAVQVQEGDVIGLRQRRLAAQKHGVSINGSQCGQASQAS